MEQYKGQNNFFSRLDPTGLCNSSLTEKSGKIQRIISKIYDRVKRERDAVTGYIIDIDGKIRYFGRKYNIFHFSCGSELPRHDNDNLKIIDDSPHGVSLVSLLPSALDFASLKVGKNLVWSQDWGHASMVVRLNRVTETPAGVTSCQRSRSHSNSYIRILRPCIDRIIYLLQSIKIVR